MRKRLPKKRRRPDELRYGAGGYGGNGLGYLSAPHAADGGNQNRFIRSFLTYVPYAVLSAMTFPAILYSTSDNLAVGVPSAAAGLLVALVLAYHNRGLLTVALASSAAVFIVQQALLWLGW